jgi:cell division protease FtsH
MNGDQRPRPEPKKGFPGGFILFLLAAFLIFLTVQNLSTGQTAKIAFSHQVEALVDLDLIDPSDSRKIAQNDNLVTFMGKFRERLTDDAQVRYKYLELLNRHNELVDQKHNLTDELFLLQKSAAESGDWFLHLSGLPLPPQGYLVVSPLYDTADRENGIVIKSLSDKPIVSLADLEKRFPPQESQMAAFSKDLLALVQGFRSSTLGIGSEPMKQQLKNLEQMLTEKSDVATFRSALDQLQAIAVSLNTLTDSARLVQLRSVRNYLADLKQYDQVIDEMAQNELQLDKARQTVANVIWYFNNQELSSRALEKQDPEVFGNWFLGAKQEYDAFQTNKGTVFRAPDQPRTVVLEKTFKSEEPSPNYLSYLFTLLPFIFLG